MLFSRAISSIRSTFSCPIKNQRDSQQASSSCHLTRIDSHRAVISKNLSRFTFLLIIGEYKISLASFSDHAQRRPSFWSSASRGAGFVACSMDTGWQKVMTRPHWQSTWPDVMPFTGPLSVSSRSSNASTMPCSWCLSLV